MPKSKEQDVRSMKGIVSYPYGIAYAWLIEKKLGLPQNSLFNLSITTERFAKFLSKEVDIIEESGR